MVNYDEEYFEERDDANDYDIWRDNCAIILYEDLRDIIQKNYSNKNSYYYKKLDKIIAHFKMDLESINVKDLEESLKNREE